MTWTSSGIGWYPSGRDHGGSTAVVVDLPRSPAARQERVVFPGVLDGPLRDQCGGRGMRRAVVPAPDGRLSKSARQPNDGAEVVLVGEGVPACPATGLISRPVIPVRSGANVKAIQNQLRHASRRR